MTQVMLSMIELQDKGKGPYNVISTLLSEYLVIQVQEGIRSNVQLVLHALTVVSGNVVLSSWHCLGVRYRTPRLRGYGSGTGH